MENKRRTYTKKDKEKILYEYSLLKKPKQAFLAAGFELNNETKDKKYEAKLINKWKKEFYKNNSSCINLCNVYTYSQSENIDDFIMSDYLKEKNRKV